MRGSGHGVADYLAAMRHGGIISKTLPATWNCRDGKGYDAEQTCLVHYKCIPTQPWEGYPDIYPPKTHPRPDMVQLWNSWRRSMEAAAR